MTSILISFVLLQVPSGIIGADGVTQHSGCRFGYAILACKTPDVGQRITIQLKEFITSVGQVKTRGYEISERVGACLKVRSGGAIGLDARKELRGKIWVF
jgi:hypothetical protein